MDFISKCELTHTSPPLLQRCYKGATICTSKYKRRGGRVRRSNVRARDAVADRYRMRRRELFLLLTTAMTAPRLVSAQQRRALRVGVLDPNPSSRQSTLAAIHEGLEDAGFSSFGLVSIEYRWAGWTDSRFNPLITLAIDLVISNVDVIVTATFSGFEAVKAATSSIPIVLIGDGNVITAGLIESQDGPGGNLLDIGLSSEGYLKQFELLAELIPQARVIAVLVNPNSKTAQRQIQQVQEAAGGMGIQVKILKAGIDVDFETAFADLASGHVAGLLVGADLFFDTWRERLVSLAARYAIPTIYGWREFTERGGLMSYGPSRDAIWRQAAAYAGKIINGTKPVDLPVQKPKWFELVVNQKTAAVLGLTIPQTILASADEVMG
jgi:putative tryptophan/tyrosine transport system substrate-binding protein